jgi:hypothetical protein
MRFVSIELGSNCEVANTMGAVSRKALSFDGRCSSGRRKWRWCELNVGEGSGIFYDETAEGCLSQESDRRVRASLLLSVWSF